MIKGQEQNQNLIEDRLPIRTEDKKRKTSLKENKFFQGLKGKAVRNTFFAFFASGNGILQIFSLGQKKSTGQSKDRQDQKNRF